MKLILWALLVSTILTYSFQDYALEFNKTYSTDQERQERQQLFLSRMAEFQAFNSQGNSYTLGPTAWTDRYDEEKKSSLPPLGATDGVSSEIPAGSRRLRGVANSSIDWRGRGVTSIKNQGQCGSCWVFTSVAMFESILMLKNDTETNISEQYVLECTGNGNSCNGGQIDDALKLLMLTGGPQQSTYPYTSFYYATVGAPNTPGICTSSKQDFKTTYANSKLLSFFNTTKQNILALLEYSPVATSIIADDGFLNYKSGIYSCNYSYTALMVNHAIQIVGYNATGDYYIIKNSWGTSWGVSGFGYVSADKDCYVRQRAYQVIWEWRLIPTLALLVVGMITL